MKIYITIKVKVRLLVEGKVKRYSEGEGKVEGEIEDRS